MSNETYKAALVGAMGSASDPRIGKLTSEEAAMLKKLAEDMGALDCMPYWMRAEIEAKTKPPNHQVRHAGPGSH